ncbi:MAG: hypothetical protein C0507_24470 [Cyanobacteria bacterium PR.3.49]|nr:hypothetical protein [Cyanobacteria bacterium PR.3.49]
MPPFDGNFISRMPFDFDSVGALARSAWQSSLMFDRFPAIEPDQLTFSNIYDQTGLASDRIPDEIEDTFKKASNVEFTTQTSNIKSGQEPDLIIDESGRLIKSPDSRSKPGDPLNIEIRSQGKDQVSDLQKSLIQEILDKFLSTHPGISFFPRTWQEVLQLLDASISGTSDSSVPITGMQNATSISTNSSGSTYGGSSDTSSSSAGYDDSGGSVYSSGGGYNRGGSESASWGSAPIRPENNIAPPIESEGKVFPVAGFSGNKIQLHHGQSDGAADIFAPEGTPIRAMVEGQVIKVGSDGAGGNTITIRQKDGKIAYYAHMQAGAARQDGTPLRAGDQVRRGEMVGRVGETGNAAGTGAHLHLGVGDDIQTGTGPEGGAGTNYNLTGTLNAILQNA